MGVFKSSHRFIYIPLGFFVIRMTRHYFPLLSVNLLSIKPVLHREEIWGHQCQLGVLGGRALGRAPLAQRI